MNIDLNDPDVVVDLLDDIVAGKEGFIYNPGLKERCRYFDNGSPSCIVGHVIDWAGIEFDPDFNVTSFHLIADHLGVANPLTVKMLREAQAKQDNGGTWGAARDAARYVRSHNA